MPTGGRPVGPRATSACRRTAGEQTPGRDAAGGDAAKVSRMNGDFDLAGDRASGGGTEKDDGGPAAPVVSSDTPEQVAELATACVNYVRQAVGVELDYTSDTLPVLDHYLDQSRALVDKSPGLRDLLEPSAGVYFGELLRRRFDAHWYLPGPDPRRWRVVCRHVLLAIDPVGMAAAACDDPISLESQPMYLGLVPADRDHVIRRLSEAPPVPASDFCLLSTRMEAIDITVETLRGLMQLEDRGEVEFELDDYIGDRTLLEPG